MLLGLRCSIARKLMFEGDVEVGFGESEISESESDLESGMVAA